MLRGKTGIHSNQQPDKSLKRTKSFYSSIQGQGLMCVWYFVTPYFSHLKVNYLSRPLHNIVFLVYENIPS